MKKKLFKKAGDFLAYREGISKKILLLLINLFIFSFSYANTIEEYNTSSYHESTVDGVKQDANPNTIKGNIVDSHGLPLIGVSVALKNSQKGSISNIDGNFELRDIAPNSILVISYIGYITQEINIGNETSFNIVLREKEEYLDEVVVVGYGSFKKRDLTGAITQVKGDDISKMPVRSASDALQGKAAGVTVTSVSGSPGSMGSVRIRGIGTVNNNDPLYVVDGLLQTDIGWLNPSDIASLEILKDASAQAIYGARAANGVVLISTKNGASSDTYSTSIEFDMNIGFQNITKRYNMLNAEEFMEYRNLAYQNAGRPLMTDFDTPEKRNQILEFLAKNGYGDGIDWWKESTRTSFDAPIQNYNLSISAGSSKLRHRASFGYMSHEGIVKGTDYRRISGRFNTEAQITKWFNLSSNINLIYQERTNALENNAYTGSIFNTLTADPISPIYRNNLVDIPDFLVNRLMTGYEPANIWSHYGPIMYSNKLNPVAQAARLEQSNLWTAFSVKGNLSGDIKILPFLTFKSNMAVDISRALSGGFTPKFSLDGDEKSDQSRVNRNVSNTDYWIFDNYLTFDKDFSGHKVNVMIGTSAEKTKNESVGASKEGLVNNDPSQHVIDAGTMNPSASGSVTKRAMNSYFGRIFYSYDNKYMATFNYRRDGSSSFAKNNRWGSFPSFSVGWNFSEEAFMKNQDWLSQGKLRGAWGQIGNQNIGTGAYLDRYGNNGYFLFGVDDTYLAGGRTSVGEPGLKWETTRQLDFGLDLAFLNGSLRLVLDYYKRDTKDMLLQVPVPQVVGLPNTPWINAGNVENRGFEVTLEYDGKIGGDFNYNINANLSTYKNEVKSLGTGASILGRGVHLGNQTYTMTEPGKPIGYYYGFKTGGIFQTQEEINNYTNEGQMVMPNAKPGDLKFVDLNKDGVLNDEDRTQIGNPHPDFTFGITLGASYRGFDFSAFFQGSVGNDVMNLLKYDIYRRDGWYNAPKDILHTSWTGPGTSNENFGISADTRNNLEISEWYIEDGSYMRLKNLTIGYTVPNKITNKLSIKDLRFFTAAQNLFTITGYSGMDPEIGHSNSQYIGIDLGFYPQTRIFMLGFGFKL